MPEPDHDQYGEVCAAPEMPIGSCGDAGRPWPIRMGADLRDVEDDRPADRSPHPDRWVE